MHRLIFCLTVVTLLSVQGCATRAGGARWAENATFLPGWNRIGDSAVDAIRDPQVWIPLLGAATFSLGNLDDEVTDWASDEAPLFGDRRSASDASDYLQLLGTGLYIGTALLTDSGDEPGEWLANKGKGLLGGLGIIAASSATVHSLKFLIDRERPGGGNGDSYPSAHTSHAATVAALASRNLDHIAMNGVGRAWAQAGVHSVAVLTGWGRMEAGRHYPSDVLAGYALGQFMGRFLNDAFLMPEQGMALSLMPADDQGGLMLGIAYQP